MTRFYPWIVTTGDMTRPCFLATISADDRDEGIGEIVSNQSSNHQFIALALLALCAIAAIVGVVQLAKSPAGVKTVSAQEPISGTFLAGNGDRLAYIALDGMIMEDMESNSIFSSESPAVRARKLLYFAAKDNSVKGVLLRLNSPGGTVGMSQELYDAVSTVRKKKPVVVSMGDLAASGAYYTAAAADKIVANPGTLTASIGVILQSINLQELMNDKLGVKAVTIKSGQFKDILNPYRPTTPEERALLQHIIDTSYQQFLGAVLEGRTRGIKDAKEKLAREKSIRAVADGRVVIGEDALKVGLVDELGGLEDAKKLLQEMAAKRFDISNPEKLTLQEYETTFSIWQILGLSANLDLKLPNMSAPEPKDMLPASMRYANRPLWLMETVY